MGVQDDSGVVSEPSKGHKPEKAVAGDKTSAADSKASSIPRVALGSGVTFSQHQPQVRVLTINHKEHLESTLFRLQKGWVLQFRPGPTLFGRHVNIFTNHPEDLCEGFMRNKYRHLEWKSDSTNKGDDTALYAEVVIILAGSFHYYFTCNSSDDRESAKGSGYYLVDPTLTFGNDDEVLPQDCVQCQTVLSKCLGPFPQWEGRLRVAKESGFNVIHFTPVQHLGQSQSSYSLADQHKLNPNFSTSDHQYSLSDVEKLVKKMRDEWKVLSLTDVVLNHTANESPWLQKHPECTYNLVNSPHLRPPYLMDRALYHFSLEVSEGKWKSKGIPKIIKEEKHVQAVKEVLHNYLVKLKLDEFYTVDVGTAVEEFRKKIKGTSSVAKAESTHHSELAVIQNPRYTRNSSSVEMKLAVTLFNKQWSECPDEETRVMKCSEEFQKCLLHLNKKIKDKMNSHLWKAVDCTLGTIRYERIQAGGPKLPEVSKRHPLVCSYFTHPGPDRPLEEEESQSYGAAAPYIMAHNGWVIGDDPLRNFAASDSNVYLRRELVAWGDSVKLRYGSKPEDSEYLWDYMRSYCEETARIFHGIRLDNCHSTPLHVAEYMLDAARKVKPDLYVIAELFTNSDLTDNIFVNNLGINSLIREAMSAPDSHEEGRLVYRYGGEPVGAFLLPPVRPLVPSIAHAIFLDLTHDNKSPVEIRTAWDMLPSTALVNMACCASGSNRGYDELIPHHIHVVKESRYYNSWSEVESDFVKGVVNNDTGIIKCRKIIHDLHFEMGANGYNQVFVDQVTEHVVTVTRHNPATHQSIVLVAFTSFVPPASIHRGYIRPLTVQGKLEEIIFEFKLRAKKGCKDSAKHPGSFTKNSQYINGVEGFEVDIQEHLQPAQSWLVKQTSPADADTTVFEYQENFRPGSVIAIRVSLLPHACKAIQQVRSFLADFSYKQRISEVTTGNAELLDILNHLSLTDLNRILYRCHQEEVDEGRGWGAYNIPNFAPLNYCGLQGMISLLSKIRVQNDLGHPFCGNLRDGNWMMDYITGRLKLESSTQQLGVWFEKIFASVAEMPRYLVPAYFDAVVTAVYLLLINKGWSLLGEFISSGSDFAKALGLCSVQFCGVVKSSLLPHLSPSLAEPQPLTEKTKKGQQIQLSATLAAGLPHFSTGYMRNWGRDTFIALPGNLLITQRFDEARWIILAYAGTLRHGLIPNLLDGGHHARFNCRDAVWFWLESIQKYSKMAPDGHRILKDKVSRLYPTDDSPVQPPGKHDQLLEDVIQEALERHFQGVKFRERNAGYSLDTQMNDHGFNNEIGVSLETGFPYGGNENNCGTWMDKMGSSEAAGTKGKPATPRDGSGVEIVGLCKSALRFLSQMHKQGKFTYGGVERKDEEGTSIKWTYEFWEKMVSDNFEKCFWINDTPLPDQEKEGNTKPELVNRRGIYKDSFGASQFWADYQLRCNFPIALAAAPEMVTPRNAWLALKNCEQILMSKLGMKTLDPSDWAYRGNYDNSNDSADPKIARGYNYHQGPEWLWPVGWFLRAKLAIAPLVGGDKLLHETMNAVKAAVAPHLTHLLSDNWRSLPELTNAEGSFCRDSNPAQSWSTGCLLEVLWEMDQIERGFSNEL